MSKTPDRSGVPNARLLLTLMVLAGLIILAIAAYIFTHLSGLDLRQSVVLIVLGVIGLVLITAVLAILLRGLNTKNRDRAPKT